MEGVRGCVVDWLGGGNGSSRGEKLVDEMLKARDWERVEVVRSRELFVEEIHAQFLFLMYITVKTKAAERTHHLLLLLQTPTASKRSQVPLHHLTVGGPGRRGGQECKSSKQKYETIAPHRDEGRCTRMTVYYYTSQNTPSDRGRPRATTLRTYCKSVS